MSQSRDNPNDQLRTTLRRVYILDMALRLNLTLDDEHAAILTELADATHMQAGTLARSMLLTALDSTARRDSAANTGNIVDLLASIPGALENHRSGLADLAAGRTVPLDEL